MDILLDVIWPALCSMFCNTGSTPWRVDTDNGPHGDGKLVTPEYEPENGLWFVYLTTPFLTNSSRRTTSLSLSLLLVGVNR